MVRSTQTAHLSCVKISTISTRTEMSFQLSLITGALKMMSKPMLHLAQTMHLSWTDTSTISKRNETSSHKTNITKVLHRVRPNRFPCLWYVRRKSVQLYCTDANNVSKQTENEISHDPRHLGVPPGASKTISKTMVRSTQTAHLSCVKFSTISTWTKTSFYLSLVT